MIKTFRGLIGDGEEDTINLHTNDGKTGYRIVKFQLFPNKPGTQSVEATVSVFKVTGKGSGTAIAIVDFSDSNLLAAAFYQNDHAHYYTDTSTVVFDHDIFNQDIYVTMTDTVSTGVDELINYYIELEQMSLDLNEATVATLQNIRSK